MEPLMTFKTKLPNVIHAVDVVDVAIEEADPRSYEHESPARRNARSD